MLTVKNGKFYLDDKEFIIYSGGFHYFRALPEYWDDILEKIKAAGLNTVETYVCWNLHEPKPGEYDFSGRLDLVSFIKAVQAKGLKLLMRIGPYICAEWENGGIPAWLFKDKNTRIRCNCEPYMTYMKSYLKMMIEKIKPYLYDNGGPIIGLALENEYGSFGDDLEYLKEIENVYNEMGVECLLFTTDGAGEVFCCSGSHDHKNIIKGMNFAPYEGNAEQFFDFAEQYTTNLPRFATEYWSGAYSWWGDAAIKTVNKEHIKNNIKEMVEKGISFNLYMMYGGTNFGFTGGANAFSENEYLPDLTSYDYDAPIREWGGYNESYHYIRELLVKDNEIPLPPEPEFQNIGKVTLTQSAPLFDNLHIGEKHTSKTTESMEYYGQNFGYILYRKVMQYDSPMDCMQIVGLCDRANIFVNGEFAGTQYRKHNESKVKLPKKLCKGDVLDILVENMGRIGYGPIMGVGDRKGITVGVMLGTEEWAFKYVFDWDVICFEMDDLSDISYKPDTSSKCPAFFKGHFEAKSQKDCFVHLDNFKKGIVYINGFNLGRYWEIGPQTALYLPGALLKEENEIIVFETDGLKGEAIVEINDIIGI